ncbi:DUF695 domain-containing protein [Lacibacter sp. H375]|uniref:DUF695 domain-containing protein n=1 Tax=Lacibacter sp. H375 TaxID=3133424 RepID=UPI0030C15DD6
MTPAKGKQGKDNMKLKLTDSWFNAESESKDNYFFLRGRDSLTNFIKSSLYNDRVEIIWPYSSLNGLFYPDDNESKLMALFEDSLVNKLEGDLHSILSFVYTGNGKRIWHWYTRSFQDFNKRLNLALSGFDKLPITIKRIHEPDWSEYLDAMRGSGLIK